MDIRRWAIGHAGATSIQRTGRRIHTWPSPFRRRPGAGARGPLSQGVHVPRAGDARRGARLPGAQPEPGDQGLRRRGAGVRLRPRPLAGARPGVQVRHVGRRRGRPPGSPASSSRRPSTWPRSARAACSSSSPTRASDRPADRPARRARSADALDHDDPIDRESPARPFSLFGLDTLPDRGPGPSPAAVGADLAMSRWPSPCPSGRSTTWPAGPR